MVTAREDAGSFAALVNERSQVRDALTQLMRESLGDQAGFLAETTQHALGASGKLLRPLLLLDACRAAGGDPDLVWPAALGTEFGHIASLIHDDIIDGDSERHGQAALHVKYTPGVAILTGDLLIFQAFLSYAQCADVGVSPERVLAAIRTLSVTCIEMCRGQALEESIAGDLETTEEQYLEVIRLKTASFCRAAARIGARLGGATEEDIATLGHYGHNLGMAFQIIDDVLSYEGSAARVGKTLSSDTRNHRVTLPIIYALRSGGPEVRHELATIFTTEATESAEAHERLKQLLVSTRGIAHARARAYRFTLRAQHHLAHLPYSLARERLSALANLFLEREA